MSQDSNVASPVFILPILAVTKENAYLVGAKAFSVARLASAGFDTPPGWCLTVNAYREVVSSNPDFRNALAYLHHVDQEDVQEVKEPAATIQRTILGLEFPASLLANIRDAFKILCGTPLAVRSSATSEDLAQAAAAGQYTTQLGVVGFDNLLAAIRQCWASLWGARAVVYRSRFGLPLEPEMAILVQELLLADVSGVLFTVNPLNALSTELLVTSAFGAGENVVSGSVDVDTFIVDRRTLAVKDEWLQAAPTTDAALGVPRSLTPEQLREVCGIGIEAEALFEEPLDIEWSVQNDRIFLLQARPVTAVSDVRPLKKFGPLERLAIRVLLEYFPTPLYHFDRSYIAPLLGSVFSLISDLGLRTPPLEELFVENSDGSLGPRCRLPTPTLASALAILGFPMIAWKTARLDPLAEVRAPRAHITTRAKELESLPIHDIDDAALIQVVRQSQKLLAHAFEIRKPFFAGAWCLTLFLNPLLRLLFPRDAPAIATDLRAGLPYPTSAMNLELRMLAGELEREPTIRDILTNSPADKAWERLESFPRAAIFVENVRRFLNRYGCRTELPIALPSAIPWAEEPAHVLRIINGLSKPAFHARPIPNERTAFLLSYRKSLRQARRWRLLRLDRLLRLLVRRNRALWLERDWAIFTYEQVVAPARSAMRELGLRLVRRGLLRSWNDIRYISIEEVSVSLLAPSSEVDVRNLVEKRRTARRRTVQHWCQAFASVATPSRVGVVLTGTPASPGIATGQATLVVSDRDIESVRPGAILVCRSTGPSWTPLFGIVAAVVTDLGGPLSHAAIVAREYGIPAVIGTGNATRTLRSGGMYTVDGTMGVVRLGKAPDIHSMHAQIGTVVQR